jgi:hypothetical protein
LSANNVLQSTAIAQSLTHRTGILIMHGVLLPRAAAAGVLAVAALLQQLHSSQLHPPTHMLVLYAL